MLIIYANQNFLFYLFFSVMILKDKGNIKDIL